MMFRPVAVDSKPWALDLGLLAWVETMKPRLMVGTKPC